MSNAMTKAMEEAQANAAAPVPNTSNFRGTKGKVTYAGIDVYSTSGKALLDLIAGADEGDDVSTLIAALGGFEGPFWTARNITGDRDSTLKVVIAQQKEMIEQLKLMVTAQRETMELMKNQAMAQEIRAGIAAGVAAATPVVPS
jgi:hypothetical protein